MKDIVYRTTSPALDSLGATPPTIYRHHDGNHVVVRASARGGLHFLNVVGRFPDNFEDNCKFPDRTQAELAITRAIERNSPRHRASV